MARAPDEAKLKAKELYENRKMLIEIANQLDGITEVKADVIIAAFRAPNVCEQIAETNAKLLYLSMITGIEMEGLGI